MPANDPTSERIDPSRRQLLQAAGGLAATTAFSGYATAQPSDSANARINKWDANADAIIEQTEEPEFPDQEFDITEYGAVGDGETDDSEAFMAAIAACTEAGGGQVVVPEGEFFHTGPIHLDDNVNLHITPSATIRFSTDPSDYLPPVFSRWQGVELMNYSPLIYAYEKENIAVTGGGTLDAQADDENWWWMAPLASEYAFPDLVEMMEEGVPPEERVFGENSLFRPPFLQPYNCKKVLFEDITVKDSPFWLVNPVLCEHVTARNLDLDSPGGPNNDGFNPESCNHVVVEGCFFDNGDDCVAVKSGRNEDGRRIDVPTENVVVQDCEMRDGHGGFVVGSEMSGGARTLYARRNILNSQDLTRVVRIKTNSTRGGFVEDYYFWDSEVRAVGQSHIRINFVYGAAQVGDPRGNFPPEVRNVNVHNVTSESDTPIFSLKGLEESPIRDLTVTDSSFPEASFGHWNPYIQDMVLRDVHVGEVPGPWSTNLLELTGPSYDLRGDISFEEVTGADGATICEEDPYLEADKAKTGTEYFVDRDYEIEDLSNTLEGGTLIRGKNADSQIQTENIPKYLTFKAKKDVTVYVAFPPEGEDEWWPDWLDNWERTGELPVSDFEDPFSLFRKDFETGRVTLGPPDAETEDSSSYFTIVTEQIK